MLEPKEYTLDAPVIIENIDEAFDIAHLSLQKVTHALNELGNQTKPLHNRSAINFFLNNHTLPLNQESELQNQLWNAYTDEKWQDPIFDHPNLQHLAFALYSQGKIDNPEFETLIRRFYLQPTVNSHVAKYGIPPKIQIHTYQLLDNEGNFTYEARQLIFPTARTMRGDRFQGARLKNFQLLAQAYIEMYPSENVFFQVKSDQLGKDELLTQLLYAHALNSPDYLMESYLLFSCLIEDAYQLSSSNIDDMVYGRLLSGKLNKSAIERCNFYQIRPVAVMGFGLPETTEVHNFNPSSLTRFSIMAHDLVYHTRICTTQGKITNNLWSYLKELSRVPLQLCTNLKQHHFPLFCKLTWSLLDAEFLPHTRKTTLENTFCKEMDDPSFERVFLFNRSVLTDFGIQVFIDMVIHAERWKNTLHFNPENMNEQYKKYYEIALKIRPFLEEDLQHNIIIFKAFLAFEETHFPVIRKYLANNYLRLQDSFEFIRNNSTQFLGLINKKLGQLDDNALAFILLQSFKDSVDITQGIDKNAYKKFLAEDGKFIKNIVLMHLYFGKNPALKGALAELRINILNMTMNYPNLLETVMFPLHQFLLQHKTLPDDQRKVIGEVIKYCFLLEQRMSAPTASLTV